MYLLLLAEEPPHQSGKPPTAGPAQGCAQGRAKYEPADAAHHDPQDEAILTSRPDGRLRFSV